jgi:hypothetical protein
MLQYHVSSRNDLKVILNHFDKYPLITQKQADYQLFKKVIELMKCKEHLTVEGLQKIVSIKAVLNKGLSEDLKAAFPDIVPSRRPQASNIIIPDPN